MIPPYPTPPSAPPEFTPAGTECYRRFTAEGTLLACSKPKCGYTIDEERASEEWLVWIIEPGARYAAILPVMKLRGDGLTADGKKWEYYTPR